LFCSWGDLIVARSKVNNNLLGMDEEVRFPVSKAIPALKAVWNKRCYRCNESKPLSEFNNCAAKVDGKDIWCRACVKGWHGTFYLDNQEKILKDSYNYADRIREYRKANRGRRSARTKERRKTDLNFKLAGALRSRLWSAIKGGARTGSAVRDPGCSIVDLKIRLEGMFQPGMTWDNWGLYGWHIDHIVPLDSFDLLDRTQFLKACHYTNLQPLWGTDNWAKNNKVAWSNGNR
jgi:hypothetical protein